MQVRLLSTLALALSLVLTACGAGDGGGQDAGSTPASEETEAASDEDLVIGGIMYARDSQYWQLIELGMQDAADELGVTLLVVLNNRELPTEAQVIDDLITRGVDGIAISPLDTDASQEAVKKAAEAGIQVVEYNTRLADRSIGVSFVGVDNEELGRAIGEKLARYVSDELGGTAKLGMIVLPTTTIGPVRKAGFESAIEGVEIQIVAEVEADTPEGGAEALEGILQRDADTDVVWAANAGSIAGAAATAREQDTDVKLFGVDMSLELAGMLLDESSAVQAISDQQPYQIGYLAVQTAVKAARGEDVEGEVTVPVAVYSKDDPAAVEEYVRQIESLG